MRDRHGRRRGHRARRGLAVDRRRPHRRTRRGGAARRTGGATHRRPRAARHAGPGQLPPPPLPVGHPRPGAGGDALRLAHVPLPPLGAHRRGDHLRGRARRARGAGRVGLHDEHRPPLPAPPRRRRPARGRDRGGGRDRPALPPLPGLDGPRAISRRVAARRRGGGPRRDPRGHRGGHRPLARPRARGDGADRRGALLTLLGHRRAHAGIGRAGPPDGRAPAHPSGRDDRRGGLLPRDVRRASGRVPRRHGLARPRRLARALRAPVAARGRAARRHRHGGGALPVVQRTARQRHRAGGRPGRGRRRGGPRRRRGGVERVGRAVARAAAGAAVRPAARGPRRHDRPHRPGARHDPRRAMPRARRRDRLARARQAGRHRPLAGGRRRPGGSRGPRRHPRDGPPAPGRRGARGGPAGCPGGRVLGADPDEIARGAAEASARLAR